MGVATAVQLGVCTVEFDSVDLGYTKGGVKVKYTQEVIEKSVDQEGAPLDEVINKQVFTVEVPLAEQDLARLAGLLPGATYSTGSGKEKMVMTGAGGVSLTTLAKVLIIKPVGGTANDWITLYKAAPQPGMEFAYEKDNVRVYTVTFEALKDGANWVLFGDTTATA